MTDVYTQAPQPWQPHHPSLPSFARHTVPLPLHHTFNTYYTLKMTTTWFNGLRRSFVDVPVDKEKDNAVSTTEFLEAAESLTTLFGT